ncbi:MAG: hypothetical protein JW717_08930 [Marinilabiliaceae bacterium]|nr:hypothetical protein [Marinilabiliaceae bacterium]
MKISFFKLPKHRVFQHDPIYYDEKKEKQKQREHEAKKELGLLSQNEKEIGFEDRIRGKMRKRISPPFSIAVRERRKSNIRLLIIIIILMYLAYKLWTSSGEWLDLIIK